MLLTKDLSFMEGVGGVSRDMRRFGNTLEGMIPMLTNWSRANHAETLLSDQMAQVKSPEFC